VTLISTLQSRDIYLGAEQKTAGEKMEEQLLHEG
jgi:hypothetical protein